MTITLTPSGLRKIDINNATDLTNWGTSVMNYNINRLDSTLLYLANMGDVTLTSVAQDDCLQWDTDTSEYINRPSYLPVTTTSSTTTTTTTT